MRAFMTFVLVLLLIAGAVAYSALFIVKQTEQALVLRFGKPQGTPIVQPGLRYKLPFVDQVVFYDKRILDLDARPVEVIAADQKRLVVDAFARWRITNPLLFYQAVRDQGTARRRLSSIMEASLRRVLGASSFRDILRDKREALMHEIARQVGEEAQDFGIKVVDVRIKRADLPQANSEAIYRRMRTEREQEAAQYRAFGTAIANKIRADAEKEATVTRANARRDGEIIRGQGDAERNKIFAEAFSQDPEFFAFYRSMQAYEEGLKSSDTRLVISPNSSFFKYFQNPDGGNRPAPAQGKQ